MAGESKAKVIPLHSNTGRTAAQRRAAQRADELASTSLAAVGSRQPRLRRTDRCCRPRDRPAAQCRRGTARGRRHPERTRAADRRGRRVRPQEDDRRLHRRRVRLRSAPQRRYLFAFAASVLQVVVPGGGQRYREPAEERCRAGGGQPRRRAAVRRADGVGGGARQPPRPPRPAAAGRRHGVRPADGRPGRAQGRSHHGVHRRRAPAARRGRADRRVPRGLQGPGQALQGPLQAAAVRSGRLRVGRAARPRHPSCRARSSAPRRSTR